MTRLFAFAICLVVCTSAQAADNTPPIEHARKDPMFACALLINSMVGSVKDYADDDFQEIVGICNGSSYCKTTNTMISTAKKSPLTCKQ
jgi:hypothetical protein